MACDRDNGCLDAGTGVPVGRDLKTEATLAAAAMEHVRAVRLARRNTFVLDACCGTATSSTGYHLLVNRYARVIGVDRDKSEAWVRKHIRPQDQHRFVFVQMDMADMTPALLDRVMRAEWGVGVEKLSHLHDSHPCTSLSRAERNGIHRHPDGRPKSDVAIQDDWMLAQTVKFVLGVLKRSPDCLVTIENPMGPWFADPWMGAGIGLKSIHSY